MKHIAEVREAAIKAAPEDRVLFEMLGYKLVQEGEEIALYAGQWNRPVKEGDIEFGRWYINIFDDRGDGQFPKVPAEMLIAMADEIERLKTEVKRAKRRVRTNAGASRIWTHVGPE